jgi:hypothetical protein
MDARELERKRAPRQNPQAPQSQSQQQQLQQQQQQQRHAQLEPERKERPEDSSGGSGGSGGSDPRPQQDLWSRIIGLRHRAWCGVRRFFLVFVVLLVAMLLHAYEPFRKRAAILIGTTSASDPVRMLSVAVPLAVAASVILAWAT